MRNQGDYIELARLAREKREQSEDVDELRAILEHCHSIERLMLRKPLGFNYREKIYIHILDAIVVAEKELKRLGVET